MLSGEVSKQVILITDGQSNKGGCPVSAAREAFSAGVIVNTVGILDAGKLSDSGRNEVKKIAEAGGGHCYLTSMEDLALTVNSITVQATRSFAEKLLERELINKYSTSLKNLAPTVRNALFPVLEKLEHQLELHLVLVVDTSMSMIKKKLNLEASIIELMLTLASRSGTTELAVIQYPGPALAFSVVKPFKSPNEATARLLNSMRYGGRTPTGPAIKAAARLLIVNEIKSSSREGIII